MKAKITGIKDRIGRARQVIHHVFFRLEDGRSARSYIDSRLGNYTRWAPVIQKFKKLAEGQEVILENLAVNGDLVNADSFFKEVKA